MSTTPQRAGSDYLRREKENDGYTSGDDTGGDNMGWEIEKGGYVGADYVEGD